MPHIYNNNWRRLHRLLTLTIIATVVQSVSAANVQFAWNSSTDPNVAGYNLAYGTTSGSYTSSVNAGNNTSATVSSLSPGSTYYFVVTAYNSIGLQSLPSNEVSLTVPGNIPPTVSLTSPQSGDKFHTSSSINLTATASDSDGTIVKVEFYQDANKIGESTASPYAATWSNPSSGSFTMTALAYDDSGAAVRSAGVGIRVVGSNKTNSSPSPSPMPIVNKVKAVALTPIIKAGDTAKFKLVTSEVDTTGPVVVNYSLGGTATAGVNYSASSPTGQLIIPAGKRGVLLPVKTLAPKGVGGNKTAAVSVLPGQGYTAGRAAAVVKILSR